MFNCAVLFSNIVIGRVGLGSAPTARIATSARIWLIVWQAAVIGCVALAAVPQSVSRADPPTGPVTAQSSTATPGDRSAEHWLPESTLALARFPDANQFREAWQNSSFGAQVSDPAFARFFDSVAAQLAGVTDGLGIGLTEFWQEVQGELSIAVVRNGAGELSVVGIADVGNGESQNLLARLEEKLRSEAADETSIQVGKTSIHSWQRSPQHSLPNLNYFVADGRLIFSDRLQTLAETARFSDASGPTALSENPVFSHVSHNVGASGDESGINWYVNPRGVLDAAIASNMAGSAAESSVGEMVNRLGVGQLKGLGGSFWLGAGGMDSVSTTYGYVDTPITGIWRAFTLPAATQTPPKWVTENVSLYSQINWGASRFADVLGELVDRTAGSGAFEKSVAGQRIGGTEVTVAQLAKQLVGPVHIAAEIPENAADLLQQRAVFAIGIEHADQLRDMLDTLAKQNHATLRAAGEQQVYEFALDTSELLGMPPMELGVVVTEDSLLFSPNVEYLAQTVAGDNGARPLAESARYQEVAAQFPSQTAMISYQRQDGRMEGLYEQLRSGLLSSGGLPGLTGQLLSFDFTQLPPFPAMSRYLQSTGSYIVPLPDGFRSVNFALPPREQ